MKACLRLFVTLAVIALAGLALAAQDRATLRLSIEDEGGGMLVAVRVTLVNVKGGQPHEVATTREGVAVFNGLEPGEYKLSAIAPGFRTIERQVTIGRESPAPLKLQMIVEVTEVVDVEERRRPLPDREKIDQNADQVNVNDDVLVGIPMAIRGDRIVEFLSRFMNSAAGVPSIVIDGHEVTRLNLPPRAIDELVVNKNPYSAEYRRPGRARIEVVSQDGSESHHHGDASVIFNNSSLAAKNPFADQKPSIEEMVGEFGFSGPIRNVKGSYLFAAELGGDRATATVNAVTLQGPYVKFVPERQGERFYTGRIDLEPTDRVDFTMRYEYESETERNGGVGGIILPELARDSSSDKHDVYITASHILSAGFIHVPSIHLTYDLGREGREQPPTGPMVLVQGAFEGGELQRYKRRDSFQADILDVATYRKGRHVLRFGGRYTPTWVDISDRNDFGGRYEFASLDLFQAGKPYVFTVNDGDPRIKYNLTTADAHFQDEFKVRPDLTLMFGLRYDWESIMEDRNNVAPRVAFSFAPGSKRTAIRGGAGLFYERLGETPWERVNLYNGDKIRSYVFNNPTYPDYRLGAAGVAPPPTRYQLAPGLRTPYLSQVSVGLDRQLTLESSISFEFLHLEGDELLRVRDANALIPGTGLRPNPAYDRILQVEGTAKMRSNSFNATFNGELGQFEGHLLYTYSRSLDDTPGVSKAGMLSMSLPSNNFNPSLDYGRADFDLTHRFSAAGVYELPREFQVGFILDAMSGLPYNITTGFDNNGDGVANDRPAGLPRNAGKSPKFFQLDMRLAKMWEMKRPLDPAEDPAEFELFLDVFNVLNTINYTDIVGVTSSSRFGLPSLAEKGRQLQLGFSYSF